MLEERARADGNPGRNREPSRRKAAAALDYCTRRVRLKVIPTKDITGDAE
jgi:hypothetical protein